MTEPAPIHPHEANRGENCIILVIKGQAAGKG